MNYSQFTDIRSGRVSSWWMRQRAPTAEMGANQRMLDEIERDMHYTGRLLGIERLAAPVRTALLDVPRHAFVPDALQDAAYDNTPLPISDGQTISQPYIVAVMTELLALAPEHRVLEIGTGSGYQTAILAHIVREVYSIEIVDRLARTAEQRLKLLGFANVRTRSGDGYRGWSEAAPFDAIMITAATPTVPPPLFDQLAPGGRLIVPLDAGYDQDLTLFSRSARGEMLQRKLLPVAFVPLTRKTARDGEESP